MFVTKKHFVILSMIIPRKESVTGVTFNVYMELLLEELNTLRIQRIWTRDIVNYNGVPPFKMHAILLWTIHDFPTFGIILNQVTKGYINCSICY